jgi:Ca2+-binding RTX toxin-like protein
MLMTAPVSPIGNIIALKGQVWAESEAGLRPLEAGSPVYQGDKIVTGPGSNAEIRFLDDTCLSQGADSALSLDQYVYNPTDESASNLGFGLLQGAFRHVSGKIAATNPENVQLESPLAVIGIRGTTTVHSINPENGAETHGVEHISDGHRIIIQDSFGETRIIIDPLTVIDLTVDTPMGFIRPMTPQELEFFQSFAPGVLELMGIYMTPEGLFALLGGAPGESMGESGNEGGGESGSDASGAGEESGGEGAEPSSAPDMTETSAPATVPQGSTPGPVAGPSTFEVVSYPDQSSGTSDSELFGAPLQLSGSGSDASGSSGSDLLPPPGASDGGDSPLLGAASSYPQQDSLLPPPQEPTGSTPSYTDPSYWEYTTSGGYPNYTWLPAGYTAVSGTDGSDTVNPGGAGSFALFGFGGDDFLSASANHIFYGGAGNDTIVGSSGADTIYGGTGDDVVRVTGAGHATNDVIDGGSGTNTLLLESGSHTQNVFSSDANLKNIQFIELLAVGGASGIDLTAQSEGFTVESNTDRAAVILSGSGNDILVGGPGYENSIDGGAGDDLIVGGDSSDTLCGGAGIDTIEAGDGNDWINGSPGADSIDGQGGINTIDYYYSDAAVNVDLGQVTAQFGGFAEGDLLLNIHNLYGSYSGNDTLIGTDGVNTMGGSAGDDSIEGLGGDDWIEGAQGNDTIFGGDGNDWIQGDGATVGPGDGNDVLIGGDGDDTIYGGGGDDIIFGGLGDDEMYGGPGGDRFIYETPAELTGDSINGERDAATLDRIGIDAQASGQIFDLRIAPGPLAAVQYIDRIDIRYDVSGLEIILGQEIAATADSNGDDILGDIRVQFRDGIGEHSQAMTNGITVDASELIAGQSLFFEGAGYEDGGQVHAGFSGNDTVTGGAGNDRIDGGGGDDVLTGGDGADIFFYRNISDSAFGAGDEIIDFDATADKLKFDPALLTGTFSYLGSAEFNNSGNTEARLDGETLFIDVSGNGVADMQIELTDVQSAELGLGDFIWT